MLWERAFLQKVPDGGVVDDLTMGGLAGVLSGATPVFARVGHWSVLVLILGEAIHLDGHDEGVGVGFHANEALITAGAEAN